MTEKSFSKKILAIAFAIIIILNFIINGSYKLIGKWTVYAAKKLSGAEGGGSLTDIDTEYSGNLWNQEKYIDINGFMAKILNFKGIYSDMGMYVTSDGIIESAYNPTSTDYETEQLIAFRDFLSEHDINLLYVNEPTKYIDDAVFEKEFGIPTYTNQNADKFMDRIRKANINCIDLRDNIRQEGLDVEKMFYRTDHHWTVPTGFWAAGIVAEGLNQYCGYSIDMETYNPDNYEKHEWKNCWLGEQGRKVGRTYVGLDDYANYIPKFKTNLSFKRDGGELVAGDFNSFIDESVYNTENDVYDNLSWHYAYNTKDCINNLVDNGKVLIIVDSYAMAMEPYLALGVHDIDCLFLRQCEEDFSIRNYVLENGYDTVILAYAQVVIGAHDDGANINRNTFRLDM